MSIKEQMHKDLIESMKAKDEMRTGALRMAKAAVMKFEVAGATKVEATDDDVLKILAREVKQRKEAADAFRQGARPDLAEKEEAEMKILQAYLPAQMSEEELKRVAASVASEMGAQGAKDFGKVMKAVMEKVKGAAEGNAVSKAVKEVLGN